jgi:hypothetical protein
VRTGGATGQRIAGLRRTARSTSAGESKPTHFTMAGSAQRYSNVSCSVTQAERPGTHKTDYADDDSKTECNVRGGSTAHTNSKAPVDSAPGPPYVSLNAVIVAGPLLENRITLNASPDRVVFTPEEG